MLQQVTDRALKRNRAARPVLDLNARTILRLLTLRVISNRGKENINDDRTSSIDERRAVPLGLWTPWTLGPGVGQARKREVRHERAFTSAHGSCLKRHDHPHATLEDHR